MYKRDERTAKLTSTAVIKEPGGHKSPRKMRNHKYLISLLVCFIVVSFVAAKSRRVGSSRVHISHTSSRHSSSGSSYHHTSGSSGSGSSHHYTFGSSGSGSSHGHTGGSSGSGSSHDHIGGSTGSGSSHGHIGGSSGSGSSHDHIGGSSGSGSGHDHTFGTSDLSIGWRIPTTRIPESRRSSAPNYSTPPSIGWREPKPQSTRAPHHYNFTIGWQQPSAQTTRRPQSIRNATAPGRRGYTTTTPSSYELWSTTRSTLGSIGWNNTLMNPYSTTRRPHSRTEDTRSQPNNNIQRLNATNNLANYFRNHSLPVIPPLSHIPMNNHGLTALPPLHHQQGGSYTPPRTAVPMNHQGLFALPPLHNQPGGTYIPPGSALPGNVIYYAQPPVISGNHHYDDDWDIYLNESPRHHRHRHRHWHLHRHDKTTTTTTTTSTTPWPLIEVDPKKLAPLQQGVPSQNTSSSTTTKPPPATPTDGWICVPIRINEPSSVDATKTIEVERVACYPAPRLNPLKPSMPIEVPAGSVALAPLYPMETPVVMQLAGSYRAPPRRGYIKPYE